MRRAAILLLMVGTLAHVAGAVESPYYRGQTAAQWLQQLSHPSASARAAAAQAFVMIGTGNEAAVEPLIGLLSDRDERVRFYVTYALGKIEVRPQQCIAALIKALPDTDEHVRYNAQWSLAQIAKQVAASNSSVDPSLAQLLAEAETQLLVSGALPGHLRQVRAALARVEQPELPQSTPVPTPAVVHDDAIDRCLKALADDNLLAKAKGIEQLKALGPEAVRRLLASSETTVKLGEVGWHMPAAIASLGEPVVPVLVEALRHPGDEASELAAKALLDLGPMASSALPELLGMLQHDQTSEAVRQQVIGIITSMGPAADGATDLLLQLLNDVDLDDSMRASAAEALGAIGPAAARAVPSLIEHLSSADVSGSVRSAMAEALVHIDPKSEEVTLALVAAFQNADNHWDAIEIADRLCKCGPGASQIVPRLIATIDETSFDERAKLLRILGELGAVEPDAVIPHFVARLIDPAEAPVVCVAAAKALGKLGPAGVRPIADVLRSGNEANRLIAARALVEIGSASLPAKDALYDTLKEPDANTELRALSAVALGQLGPAANNAATALTELLLDAESDTYLRAMCAVALGQVDPAAAPILESMLEDAEAEVQIAAAYSLCKIDPQHERGLAKLVSWLESDEFRGSAVSALIDIGDTALARVVETMNDPAKSRDTRVSCLEIVRTFDEGAIPHLLLALNDQTLADEAGWALRDFGNALLPTLVAKLDDEATFTPQARTIMGGVIQDMFSGLGGGDRDSAWMGGHPLVKRSRPAAAAMAMEAASDDTLSYGMAAEPSGGSFESPELSQEPIEAMTEVAESPAVPNGYKTVDVFYGTNRKPIDEGAAARVARTRWLWSAAIGVLVLVIILIGMYRRGARRQATAGLAGLTLILFLGLLLFVPAIARPAIDKSGPRYGGEYSERVEMGICQVTIPHTHREGELEAPTLLRLQVAEDLDKHIVLRNVERMESAAFFAGLRNELQSKGNNILVFIHGYNVSFEDAARRTAQMSSDLKFAGAPIFYSWPSQAELLKYRVDEKNVELSVDQLKSFLLAIAEQSHADTINLVAHSMGNRALTDALKEMDVAATAQQRLFNQVILAAPDIDADIFRQRIAPAIVTKAKHITLYASSKDLALVASRRFNSGDPRAGDAGGNLVVVPGIETIDVSSGDSSLLGHSYYGDNVSVLRDIEFLLRDEPAGSRQFLEPVSLPDDRTYWLFQPQRISRRTDAGYQSR